VEYGVNDGVPDPGTGLSSAIRRTYERLLRRLLRFRNRPALVHVAMQSYEFLTDDGRRCEPLDPLRL